MMFVLVTLIMGFYGDDDLDVCDVCDKSEDGKKRKHR